MKSFIGLTKRNLLLYFKDKQAMFFSLLTSIIVFVLYLFFLKGTFVDEINSSLEAKKGLKDLIGGELIDMYVNATLLVGILGSAMITIPYHCLTAVVKDRENKVDYDILAAPVKRWKVILSYSAAAMSASVLMMGTILTIGLLILSFQGELCISSSNLLFSYLAVILGAISSTALFMIPALLFQSVQASGAFFGMLSAVSGFVIGAYIPISNFSGVVQTVCNLFPASQATTLVRNTLLNGLLYRMNENIGGVDGGKFVEAMRELFSFRARLFGGQLEVGGMTVYILTGIVISVMIQMVLFSKTYIKK